MPDDDGIRRRRRAPPCGSHIGSSRIQRADCQVADRRERLAPGLGRHDSWTPQPDALTLSTVTRDRAGPRGVDRVAERGTTTAGRFTWSALRQTTALPMIEELLEQDRVGHAVHRNSGQRGAGTSPSAAANGRSSPGLRVPIEWCGRQDSPLSRRIPESTCSQSPGRCPRAGASAGDRRRRAAGRPPGEKEGCCWPSSQRW